MDARCDRCQQPLPEPTSGGDVVCPHCGHVHAPTGIDVALDDELGQAFENVFLSEDESDPAAVEWYVAIDGQQVGPVSFADLSERWARGVLGPDSLCWRAGLSDWVPIRQLPDLIKRLPAQAKSAAGVAEPKKAEVSAEAKPAGAKEAKTEKSSGAKPDAAAKDAAKGAGARSAAAETKEREWKPSAGVALESLVEKEVEEAKKRQDEAPAIPDPETTGIRVVLRDLPEPPPPEPSKFIPIPKNVPAPAPAPAPRVQRPIQTAAREPQRSRAPLFVALTVLVLAGGAAAAYFTGLLPVGASSNEPPAVRTEMARAEPPPPAQPAPAPAQPGEGSGGAPQGESVAASAGGGGGTSEEKQAGEGQGGTTVASAEETAEAEPEPKPKGKEPAQPKTAVAKAPARRAAPEPKRQATAAQSGASTRESRSAPAPASTSSQPSGKRDLLAAGKSSSIDALFEKELSSPAPRPAERKGSDPYIPPPPGSGVQKPRQLGQGDIMSVVASHRGELRTCANRYKEQGGSSGSVVMSWVIEPDGRTSNVKAVKGQEHAGMVRCLEEQIRKWKFPSYSGPRMEAIEFPFQF